MRLQYSPDIKIILMPCTGRVDIIHLLKAFEGGADSVFVAGKLMKRNGKLLHVDWNVMKQAVNESRDYVIKKSGFKLPKI